MKKTDVTQPVAMATPFAEGVYSATSTDNFEIPAATSTTADDSCVMDNGFLPITSTALDDGGKAPERKNFNGMFYLSTDQRFFLQNGGFITYNPDVATAIGGYPQDAILDFIDSNGNYKKVRSLIDDNTNNFVADETLIDGTNWAEISIGGGGLEIGDIGIAPLGIDETKNKRRYLNGQVIIQDQYVSFTNKLKSAVALYPSLACTEAQWQATATLSVGGQCGKFVIDDTAGTIRLPKIIMPIQGLTNLASLAEIVEAGLPNITGYVNSATYALTNANGAFFDAGGPTGQNEYGSVNDERLLGFNASRSSSIYGNSTTVQQEQIQYPYFIQVATGVEESVDVTREIELNNPFSLFDYKYSEYELDNISWLRSSGQYNPKAVYPDAYDYLLREYNNPDRLATFNSSAFTVIGSPTITNDGIASGFSGSNYINAQPFSATSNTDFEIITSFKVSSFPSSGSKSIFRVATNNYMGSFGFSLKIDNLGRIGLSGVWSTDAYYSSLSANVFYTVKVKVNNGVASLYLNDTLLNSSAYTKNIASAYLTLGTGSATDYLEGSIDLKQFSITVDGERVFSGANSKVKLSTETYADTDFVLNTTDETFRLPLKVALASGKAVVGNGMTLGLTNGTQFAGLGKSNNSGLGYPINIYSNSYGSIVGSALSGDINNMNNTLGVTPDATKSGIETSDNNLYLYFYVGETVQNANLINAGRIEEKLTTIIPDNSNLIASYGMPDFDNIISFTGTITLPCDALVFASGGSDGAVIKGQGFKISNKYFYNSSVYTASANVIASKGTVVEHADGNCYYCPLKGTN